MLVMGMRPMRVDQVISREELRSKLLPVAPDRYRAIIATAAGTGLRWREATSLQLDALDLNLDPPVRFGVRGVGEG